jgi:hypothetical protein
VTEDEARTKWCPFVRLPGDWQSDDGKWLSATVNRPLTGGLTAMRKSSLCMASDCMAWRRMHVAPIRPDEKLQVHGFCGLAGREGSP